MNPRDLRFKCHGAVVLAAALSLHASPASAYAAGQWGSAERIYQKVCSYCHDISVAPPLFGRNLSGAQIRAIVLGGRGPMPAFRPTDFSEEELAALGVFLQTPRPGRVEKPSGRPGSASPASGEHR